MAYLLGRIRGTVTAILAGNDDVAYGAWEALNRHGLTVPGDVSLIGFDDQYGPRRFSAIDQRSGTHGYSGAGTGRKMAIEKIKTGGQPLPEVIVPTKLESRGTCRPAVAGQVGESNQGEMIAAILNSPLHAVADSSDAICYRGGAFVTYIDSHSYCADLAACGVRLSR